MSPRKSRTSLGTAATGTALPRETIEAFEDFRRRHSRQNKDIIIENSLRRTTIKTLQDEVAALHVELLQVRQANLYLTSHVKRLQQEKSRQHGDATRDAIDQILMAVPALRQLRDTLGDSTANSRNPFGQEDGQGWAISCVENPTATRPAATAAAEMNKLETLMETSEYGSDGGVTITVDDSRVRRKSKARRRTEIGSVAAPRSPRPPGSTRQPPSDLFVVDTIGPASPPTPETVSPDTVKEKSPAADRKTKRRRESGLLSVPPMRSPTPPPADTYVEISDNEDDKITLAAPTVTQRPSSARGKERAPMVKVRDIAAGLASDRLGSAASVAENTLGVEEGVDGVIAAKGLEDKVAEQLSAATTGRSRPSEATLLSTRFSLLTTAESEAAADEEGGRGRRARKSVNYKEPSLTKKMRKPDGVSAEEVIRLPRYSLSSASTLHSEDGLSASSKASPPKSKGSKRALSHMTGPRRKSVLPRAASTGRKTPADDDDSDDDDYVDLDDLKAVHDPSDEEDAPLAKAAPAPASDPAPAPAAVPAPAPNVTNTRPLSARQSIAKENKAAVPARASPRKTARTPSAVGIGKPVGARIPTVASRVALKDRTDNGTGVRSVSASATKATVGRSVTVTAGGRRISSQ